MNSVRTRPLSASLENCAQDRGAVGHDSVNPEIKKSVHLFDIVDGPNVNLKTGVMSPAQKSSIDERNLACMCRHLEAIARRNLAAQAKTRRSETSDALRPH